MDFVIRQIWKNWITAKTKWINKKLVKKTNKNSDEEKRQKQQIEKKKKNWNVPVMLECTISGLKWN